MERINPHLENSVAFTAFQGADLPFSIHFHGNRIRMGTEWTVELCGKLRLDLNNWLLRRLLPTHSAASLERYPKTQRKKREHFTYIVN